ncbi:hypothetical protein [Bacillus testis]|nr:hypothetical protein [Bacillus testis]
MGEDIDPVGAGGLFYGLESISGKWKRGFARIGEIEELCEPF